MYGFVTFQNLVVLRRKDTDHKKVSSKKGLISQITLELLMVAGQSCIKSESVNHMIKQAI